MPPVPLRASFRSSVTLLGDVSDSPPDHHATTHWIGRGTIVAAWLGEVLWGRAGRVASWLMQGTPLVILRRREPRCLLRVPPWAMSGDSPPDHRTMYLLWASTSTTTPATRCGRETGRAHWGESPTQWRRTRVHSTTTSQFIQYAGGVLPSWDSDAIAGQQGINPARRQCRTRCATPPLYLILAPLPPAAPVQVPHSQQRACCYVSACTLLSLSFSLHG